MHKWYVIHVFSGQERKVKKLIEEGRSFRGLSDSIVQVLMPTENVAEVKGGEQRVSEKRLWPGYLLVEMTLNDETWSYIKSVSGVVDFLGGVKPISLLESEVNSILLDIEAKKKEVVHKHNIQVGDRVKIVDGVFVNFVGVIEEVFREKGCLSVLVSIFGRETRVDDLEIWQVERVANEE